MVKTIVKWPGLKGKSAEAIGWIETFGIFRSQN